MRSQKVVAQQATLINLTYKNFNEVDRDDKRICLYHQHCTSGAVFRKGLSQVLGLSWLYFYTKVKPKTWLRPFVNTAPGDQVHALYIAFSLHIAI